MILKFVVAERSLVLTDVYTASNLLNGVVSFPPLSYFGHLILHVASVNGTLKRVVYDMYYAVSLTFNISKTFYSYGVQKTMYPDQGLAVNVFSTLPKLVYTSAQFRPLYSVGNLVSTYVGSVSAEKMELLSVFQKALHNVPFLFPYERVEINSHGPYNSVEEYLTIQLYVAAFTLKLKHAAWVSFFSKLKSDQLSAAPLNINALFGFSSAKSFFFFKSYSTFFLPFLTLIDFYGSESRMFFYLFFQQVKHRKVLE